MSQSPTIYKVTRRVMTELGANIPVQMDDKLFLLDPNQNPFTLMTTQVPKRKVGDDTYLWHDDEIVPEQSTLTAASAAIAAAATGTWNVVAGTRFAPWDIVKNMATGSWGQVTAVSTNALTVDAHVAILASTSTDDVIQKIGNSMEEGGGIPTAFSTLHTERSNNIQHFYSPVRFTEMAKNADDYFGDFGADYIRTHAKVLKQHARWIEWAFLFNGAPGAHLPDTGITTPADLANNLGISMGLEYFIETYAPVDNVKTEEDLTKAEFFNWLEPNFEFGSDQKTLYASPKLHAALMEWHLGQIRFEPSKSKQTLGLNFAEITLPFGPSSIKLVNHRMLKARGGSAYNYAFLVDHSDEKIKYVYFNKMDTRVQRDLVKDGTTDAQVDCVKTSCGTQFRLAECHGMLKFKTFSS